MLCCFGAGAPRARVDSGDKGVEQDRDRNMTGLTGISPVSSNVGKLIDWAAAVPMFLTCMYLARVRALKVFLNHVAHGREGH